MIVVWSRAIVITVQTGARVQAADHQRRLAGGSKWALAAGGWDNVDSVMCDDPSPQICSDWLIALVLVSVRAWSPPRVVCSCQPLAAVF